jgi:hypothetical protein
MVGNDYASRCRSPSICHLITAIIDYYLNAFPRIILYDLTVTSSLVTARFAIP